MLVIIGYIIVCASVFGGFALAGGHLAALFQPLELLMIGGAALGTFFVGNDAKAIRATFAALPTLFHGSQYTKARYMELMGLMYEILSKIRKEGLMSVEDDIDDPYRSAIFVKYPYTLGDEHILEFITDYLRLMVSGNMDAYQIENLMDNEIETHHEDAEMPIQTISQLADAMPAAAEMDPELCYLGFEIRLQTKASKSDIERVFDFVRDDCELRILPPHSNVADYLRLITELPEDTMRLGEMLVRCGALTQAEIDAGLKAQTAAKIPEEETPPPLGEILVHQL